MRSNDGGGPTSNTDVVAPVTAIPRLSKTSVHLPIVYGSMAFPLKKVEEYNTHQWTVYIRGPNNEDLSNAISKVIFQLHPSFLQPVRELTQSPYEVTEKGWGEFDITIRILWKDETEKPITLITPLKLYAYPGMIQNTNTTATTSTIAVHEPIIYETYDEVIFTDPVETFYNQLMFLGTTIAAGSNSSSTNSHVGFPKIYSKDPQVQEKFPFYSDEEDVKILLEAQKFISMELSSVKDRIIKAKQAQEELDVALVTASELKKGTASTGGPINATTTTTSSKLSETKSGGGGTASNSNNNIHTKAMTAMNHTMTKSTNSTTKSPSSITTKPPPTKKIKKTASTIVAEPSDTK